MKKYVKARDSLNCRKCGEETEIIDTRGVPNKREVRRRRVCVACGERFTTYEMELTSLATSIMKITISTETTAETTEWGKVHKGPGFAGLWINGKKVKC